MGLHKNVASQRWIVFAFDRTTNVPKTGDAANISAKIAIDGAAAAATNDVAPTELEDGYYAFDLTQAETNGDQLWLTPESSTADIQVIGAPAVQGTVPAGFSDDAMRGTDLAALATVATEARLAELDAANLPADLDAVLLDTGTSLPDQIGSIASTSAGGFPYEALGDNVSAPLKGVTYAGVATSGTFASTEAEDGVYDVTDDNGLDVIDKVYQFNVTGARVGATVEFSGYLKGANDSILVQSYDGISAGWDTRFTLSGQAGTVNVRESILLLSKHTGLGTDLGEVLIRFVSSAGIASNPTLHVDSLTVIATNQGQSIGYANGSVYVNTLVGVAGTVPWVNGVGDKASLTLADALVIAAAINLAHIHLANGSSIALTADSSDMEFSGDEYIIAFGGVNIDNTSVTHALMMTGVFTGYPHLLHSGIGAAGITGPGAKLGWCALRGPVTSDAATYTWVLHDCWGVSVGVSEFNFGAAVAAAQTVYITSYHGPLAVSNMDHADDVLYLSGNGNLVVSASSTAGKIYLSGQWTVVNNGTTTIVYDKLQTEASATLVDTDVTIPALIAALNDLTAAQVGDAVLDEVVENSKTLRELLRGYNSALLAKTSGFVASGAGAPLMRDLADSKNRITGVTDANGNRTSVTLDLT